VTRTPSITHSNIRTYDKAGDLSMSAGSSGTPSKSTSTFGASKINGHVEDSADTGSTDVDSADVNSTDVDSADVNSTDVNSTDVDSADVDSADVDSADDR
jgi:hypothetical protein